MPKYLVTYEEHTTRSFVTRTDSADAIEHSWTERDVDFDIWVDDSIEIDGGEGDILTIEEIT